MKNYRYYLFSASLIASVFGQTGCDRKAGESAAAHSHQHEHKAPHGGTAVVLGDEAYHVEFVLHPVTGLLQAYLFDGELENFVRSTAPSFEISVTTPGGAARTVLLLAVANPATGETEGDTSLFAAQADGLKNVTAFAATLKSLTLRGSTFTDVHFDFPAGSDLH